MANAITFTGLGSGLDTDSIVKGLVDVQRKTRIAPLEEWKSQWEEKQKALREINQKLSSLYSTVQSMDTEGELIPKSISTSNSTVLTASATSSASNGSHDIVVNQLAKPEVEVHTVGETSSDTVINNSGSTLTFKYSYGSSGVTSVDVPHGTTLSGLVSLINNDPNNPGVKASILYDGSMYHLKLTGNDSGASNTIVIDPDLTATLTNYTNGTFTESQTAQNAQVKVDGYPPGGWIERSNNSINDIITGVTIDLLSTGSTTITISDDISSMKENLQKFIDAYNELSSIIRTYSYYDLDTKTAGILNGNYAVQIVETQIRQILNNTPPGFSSSSDPYTSLLQIGFYNDTSTKELTLDTAIFDNAFNSYPQAVKDLLVATFKASTTDNNISYYGKTSGTQPGIYEVEVDTNTGQGRFRPQGDDWHPWVTLEGTSGNYFLTGQAGYAEEGLAVHITYTANSGTHSATISLKNGVFREVGQTLSDFTNTLSGPFNVLIDNYSDVIDGISKKIESEEDRLSKYEEMLKQKYARLESILGNMNETLNYLSRLSQNNNSNK